MQEYKEALVILRECKYRRALDDLERLVVQRLFEMKKLGMSGVGYKLREKISKSLKTRAGAIQSALKRYNEAVALMVPPRVVLTWESVITAVNLADFNLLRDTRQDIRMLEWAQPANREAMVMYFQIKRAKEELLCLNVEIRRLLTFMYDDHVDHYRAVSANIMVNPPLAFEISTRWQYRNKIHEQIARRLLQTSRLPGFSGALFYGRCKGRDSSLNEDTPAPAWARDILGITQIDIDIVEVDDLAVDDADVDMDSFITFLDDVSIADS
ncbi:hypothetical protein CVT25_001363 [Psilocybe cyanescens]|uniref:Uncharacterized protein n=1 Tax=Psilocybe cyanescens TaxID=93625 RepID=A0A409X8P7_PSICY|nr:hypothetical protein CVT25_001363 [Psilocybe cyanescens]